MNAKELRGLAYPVLATSSALDSAWNKMTERALEGKMYVKFGFPCRHISALELECKKEGIKFKDLGNDGSGSSYTTIYLDWSVNGDGVCLQKHIDENL